MEEGKSSISSKGKKKMRSIPGSIYLPRKRFPTKQKYQQETAERERESRGQFKAHKRTTDSLKEEVQCSFSLQNVFVYTMYDEVEKEHCKAGVVKKVQK